MVIENASTFERDPSCTIKRWYSLNPPVAFFRSHVVRLAFANLLHFSNIHMFPQLNVRLKRFDSKIRSKIGPGEEGETEGEKGREREREREKSRFKMREIVKTDSYVFYTLR